MKIIYEIGQCTVTMVTFFFLSFIEPARRTTITTQTSEESGTVVMDTDMTSSTSVRKTSTVVLFTMEGMELVLTKDTRVCNNIIL